MRCAYAIDFSCETCRRKMGCDIIKVLEEERLAYRLSSFKIKGDADGGET